jgi:hypothetical protein
LNHGTSTPVAPSGAATVGVTAGSRR